MTPIETIHSPFTVQAWIENFDPLKKDFLDFQKTSSQNLISTPSKSLLKNFKRNAV